MSLLCTFSIFCYSRKMKSACLSDNFYIICIFGILASREYKLEKFKNYCQINT